MNIIITWVPVKIDLATHYFQIFFYFKSDLEKIRNTKM